MTACQSQLCSPDHEMPSSAGIWLTGLVCYRTSAIARWRNLSGEAQARLISGRLRCLSLGVRETSETQCDAPQSESAANLEGRHEQIWGLLKAWLCRAAGDDTVAATARGRQI